MCQYEISPLHFEAGLLGELQEKGDTRKEGIYINQPFDRLEFLSAARIANPAEATQEEENFFSLPARIV